EVVAGGGAGVVAGEVGVDAGDAQACGGEHQVADQRDVVVPGDGPAAAHAMGARFDDTAVARPTVNAHVEEAADEQAEEERDDGFDHRGTGTSVSRVPCSGLVFRRTPARTPAWQPERPLYGSSARR